jgi:hypothetical protein
MKTKKPDFIKVISVSISLYNLEKRLSKLTLPPGFEDATKDLRAQLIATADRLGKAADVLEAELIANNPDYAEMVRKRAR